jgi:palmitoyl-protein thioesterase
MDNPQKFQIYFLLTSSQVIPLRETQLYKEDWLGLKKMDQEEKLVFIDLEEDHLRFTMKWLADEIIKKYF